MTDSHFLHLLRCLVLPKNQRGRSDFPSSSNSSRISHDVSRQNGLCMTFDLPRTPEDGIPPRFRTRAASLPQSPMFQTRLANMATDHDAIYRFRRRILDAAEDIESLDGFLDDEEHANDGMKADGECILVLAESGDVVASARMIPLERAQSRFGNALNGRRLAEYLGGDLVKVVWSQHVLIDPEVPEAAVVKTLSTAMSDHARRRGWKFVLCFCVEFNATRRERIGFTRLGVRIDRENQAPLEILYQEI